MRPRWDGAARRCRRIVRRFVCLITLFGGAALCFGCSSSSGNDGYQGISREFPTGSASISSQGLIAAFDMQTRTPEGLLYDFSPHAHHGAIIGTTSSPGIFGDALRFESALDRVDLPETPYFDMDGPVSIALWVRIDTLGLHQHIIAVDDKFVVWITPQNHIRFTDTLGHGIESLEGVEAGRWYSLTAVMAGTCGTPLSQDIIGIYLDGEAVAADLVGGVDGEAPVWSPGPLHPSDAAYIGFESHQGDPMHQELPFEGAVDEVLIFDRALTYREVLLHADRALPVF